MPEVPRAGSEGRSAEAQPAEMAGQGQRRAPARASLSPGETSGLGCPPLLPDAPSAWSLHLQAGQLPQRQPCRHPGAWVPCRCSESCVPCVCI